MKKCIGYCWLLLNLAGWPHLKAQPHAPLIGLSDPPYERHALVGGFVVTHAGAEPQRLTVLIDQGRIVNVTPDTAVPPGYVRWDMRDKWIYPGFVDLYVPMPAKPSQNHSQGPQYGPSRKGAYPWNDALHPHYRMVEHLPLPADRIQRLRNAGFGAVLAHRADGIIRGSGPLLATIDGDRLHEAIYRPDAAWFLSFKKGSSRQSYPSSLMGAIALLRQTYYDLEWFRNEGRRQLEDLGLEALDRIWALPAVFEATDKYDIARIHRLGKELGKDFIIRAPFDAYQLRTWLRNHRPRLIVAPALPKAPDVESPSAAAMVDWADLKHWELGPWALGILYEAGVPFILTMDGLDEKTFWKNLRKAVRHGLPPDEALRALTLRPAQWIHADDRLGAVQAGMEAHLIVTSGEIWSDTTDLLAVWVRGKPHIRSDEGWNDTRGTYLLRFGGREDTIRIEGRRTQPKWKIKRHGDSVFRPLKHRWAAGHVHFVRRADDSVVRFSGHWKGGGRMEGTAYDGHSRYAWTMHRIAPPPPAKQDSTAIDTPDFYIPHPFVGLAPPEPPLAERILFKGATVWTGEEILANADVLIDRGKILKVGRGMSDRTARVIDARGLHLTAGIIDEHAHIAISRGVNEGSHPVTSEVRIGDVINPADVNIYRQLAGGVTTSHLLHGSANPIGGQTALIKLRWGEDADGLRFGDNPPFIKFALGENVKQSNWGDRYTIRYPQTRMGVEQIIADALAQAKAYDSLRSASSKLPVRRNLRLEALAEILRHQRHITCHSYVQSEILMLMRLTERFGFKVNTFTHVLEGYKVAPEMKAHGAGASTFSDWWAYKYEVIDAIPYNAAILTQMGVVTAINSDDAEMGRRLNHEAAKSIKYGGLRPEEAWKLITINPARLLRIDDRTGSIRPGKDADLVLWDGNPLSTRARVVQTYVDGRRYYDRDEARRRAQWVAHDKERLIRKVLGSTSKNERKPVQPSAPPHYHCETVGDFLKEIQP